MNAISANLVRFTLALLIAAAVFVYASMVDTMLWDPAFVTGWVLLSVILVLLLFGSRKTVSVLPLGPVRAWTQIHLVLGWVSVAVS